MTPIKSNNILRSRLGKGAKKFKTAMTYPTRRKRTIVRWPGKKRCRRSSVTRTSISPAMLRVMEGVGSGEMGTGGVKTVGEAREAVGAKAGSGVAVARTEAGVVEDVDVDGLTCCFSSSVFPAPTGSGTTGIGRTKVCKHPKLTTSSPPLTVGIPTGLQRQSIRTSKSSHAQKICRDALEIQSKHVLNVLSQGKHLQHCHFALDRSTCNDRVLAVEREDEWFERAVHDPAFHLHADVTNLRAEKPGEVLM